MSNPIIKGVLQQRLTGLSPPIPIAWENTQTTVLNPPYQRVFFLPAEPTVSGISDRVHARHAGIMQVSYYGLAGIGSAEADAQTERIRQLFPMGLSVIKSGWQIRVLKVGSSPAMVVDGIYLVAISVHYEAFEL